jgi:hypothetical protein
MFDEKGKDQVGVQFHKIPEKRLIDNDLGTTDAGPVKLLTVPIFSSVMKNYNCNLYKYQSKLCRFDIRKIHAVEKGFEDP